MISAINSDLNLEQDSAADSSRPQKIVLAGGSGFIGKYLQDYYRDLGYQVLLITRKPGKDLAREQIAWSDTTGIIAALENASLVVNLAGKSVNCRYNEANKAMIMSSRLDSTSKIGEAILACKRPPLLWINSSTGTIYRHAEDHKMTEKEGEIGSGFSVEVAKAWERAFFSFTLPNTRQAALRITIVLGKDGGALPPYVRLVKFGFGGAQGSGNQMFSWVHIVDLVGAIHYIEQNCLEGIFNIAAPTAVNNRDFMRTLRGQVKPPLWLHLALPTPSFVLKLGAGLIGTSSELLLKSRWVYPENLLEKGFHFKYPALKGALQQILGSDPVG